MEFATALALVPCFTPVRSPGLCQIPTLGRAGCLGRAAANAGRSRSDRRLAAHDRQHHGARPLAGSGRERGTHKEGFGRSRGGFTSKIHARADGQGRPLGFIPTSGEVSDYQPVNDLIELPVGSPKAMLADKGYDSDDVRGALLLKGILRVIPPRANRKQPIDRDFGAYRDRNRVERMFNRIKQFRRIATRYDKTALSFLGFLNIAAAKVWLPSYVNRTQPRRSTTRSSGRTRSRASSPMRGWRSTTTSPRMRSAAWHSAGRTTSSPAPTAAGTGQRRCTRSCRR